MNEPLVNAHILDAAPTNTISTLPSGTLTFLFTDIEGSTSLWDLYPDQMNAIMARHDTLIDSAVENLHGVVVRPRGEGDSRFVVFKSATDAVAAASRIQLLLYKEQWNISQPLLVRIALHTGEAKMRQGDYYGGAVNRCASIRGLAHGGQTLVSSSTYELVRDSLPNGISLHDIGDFMLKGIKRPERIYQLITDGLPDDFPPLQSMGSLRGNLTASLSSFVGREDEILEIKRLLTQIRFLTIAGTGGAGKTRLAQEIGGEVRDSFADGVWLVELAPLSDPTIITQHIASTLDIRDAAGISIKQLLFDYLHNKTLLLILDNCEHLLEDAARLVESLLRNSPGLHVLATSRQPFGISGETIWHIPTLSVPETLDVDDIDTISQYDAVRLFVDRATAAKPSFELSHRNAAAVSQICARLDGIPLAIELAAARVRFLPVNEILKHIDGHDHFLAGNRTAPPRQQTLQKLIDWSYNLLSANERILFQRLSIFPAGWNLHAAQEICSGGGIEKHEILDLLTCLLDKSLVVADNLPENQRFHFLETIRHYARGHFLERSEIDEYRTRHARYYLKFSEEYHGRLWGQQQAHSLTLLESERENIRTSLEWLAENPKLAELFLRMAASLWRFWEIRGYTGEGRSWLERALAEYQDAPVLLRANGLRGAGMLALQQGDYRQAKQMHEQSLKLFVELDNKPGIARQKDVLGEVAQYQGDYSLAVELHSESLALSYEIKDKESIAVSLGQLGIIALDRGDSQLARDYLEQSLQLNRGLEDKLFTALSHNNLGFVAYHLCEYGLATSHFEKAQTIFIELNDRSGISDSLLYLGNVAKDKGELRRAKTLYHQSLEIKKEIGDRRGIARLTTGLAEVSFLHGNYHQATKLVKQSLELSRNLGIKRCVIVSLITWAYIAYYQGEYEHASSLAQEGLILSTDIDYPRAAAYAKEVDGLGAYAQGNLALAARLLQEALAAFKEINDRRSVAFTLTNLARTAYRSGDNAGASAFINTSLAIARELDTRWILGFALEIQGLLERGKGRDGRAGQLFLESLLVSAEQENQQGVANCLGALAGSAVSANRLTTAARLFAAAEKLRLENGVKMSQGDQREYDLHFDTLLDQLDLTALETAWQEGYTMSMDQLVEEIRSWVEFSDERRL